MGSGHSLRMVPIAVRRKGPLSMPISGALTISRAIDWKASSGMAKPALDRSWIGKRVAPLSWIVSRKGRGAHSDAGKLKSPDRCGLVRARSPASDPAASAKGPSGDFEVRASTAAAFYIRIRAFQGVFAPSHTPVFDRVARRCVWTIRSSRIAALFYRRERQLLLLRVLSCLAVGSMG